MKPKGIAKLFICILTCEAVGAAGSLAVTPNLAWYATLNKPFWTPPNWLFGPVWVTLYALMGAVLFLIIKAKKPELPIEATKVLFGFQLFVNFLWSVAFFGLHDSFYAADLIALLWFLIAMLIWALWTKINRKAAALLMPYLVWVTIAASLNIGVLLLN